MSAKPWLVMVTGAPGSGKTTLGLALSSALRIPHFSRDLVRGGMLATDGVWTNTRTNQSPRETAVEAHVRIIEAAAANGVSCVIEFVVTPDRVEAMRRIEAATNVLVVVTACEDPDQRAQDRDRADPFFNRPAVLASLGAGSIDEFVGRPEQGRIRDEMLTDFDAPTLHVATDAGYDPSLEAIVEWIVDQTRLGAQ